MRTEFLFLCIESSIGTQGEVSRLYKCFKFLLLTIPKHLPPRNRSPLPPGLPQVVYTTDCSKAVVSMLLLLDVALWLILRGDLY